MDIRDIRHKNFLALIDEHSSQIGFAEATGLQPARVSHLATRVRNIGEKAARDIESRAGKAAGWLDVADRGHNLILDEIKEALAKVDPILYPALLAQLQQSPKKKP